MTTNSPTVADLLNVTPGTRAGREVYTALVIEHQQELEERGVPTGPDAGPAPAADLAHLTLPDLLVELFKAQEAAQVTEDLQAELAVRQGRLERAFAAVRPVDHWKDPIEITLGKRLVGWLGGIDLIVEAIAHFTATEAEVVTVGSVITFRAAGYRAGPAGDH